MFGIEEIALAALEYGLKEKDFTKTRMESSRLVVAWERLRMSRACSPHAIRAGLQSMGFDVYRDEAGDLQLHSFEADHPLSIRFRLIAAAATAFDLTKVATKRIAKRLTGREGQGQLSPALLDQIHSDMSAAVDYYLTGHFQMRKLAAEKFKAATAAIPENFYEMYDFADKATAMADNFEKTF